MTTLLNRLAGGLCSLTGRLTNRVVAAAAAGLLALASAGLLGASPAAALQLPGFLGGDVVAVRDLPPEARETLALIHQGGPFPYAKDGSVFGHYERQLPKQKRGYYTEYTVPTPGLRNRGPKRIVAGKGETGDPGTSGEYWYTADHYKTFRRIKE